MSPQRYHKHIYQILLVAICIILVLTPFLKDDNRGRLFLSLLLLLVVLGAMSVLATSRHVFVAGLALGLFAGFGAPALHFMGAVTPALHGVIRYSLWGAYLSFFALVMFVLLKSIFTDYRVTGDKIYAAISCYLILGIFWALIYAVIEDIDPTAFGRVMPQWGGSFSELIYYSFTTLTTLGYGDITPETAVAQTFSYLEAISGQLFVTILIARLVGMNIAQMAHFTDKEGK